MRRTSRSQLSWPVALFVTGSLALVFALAGLILTGVAVLNVSFLKLSQVAEAAHTTPLSLISQGISGWLATPIHTNNKKNFLVLGIDSLETRGAVPPLTDTILLLSLDLQSGQISALSIPRDTWSDKYQIRVNALYATGLSRELADPSSLLLDEVKELTNIPIHHTVILSLEEVAQIIDLIGGVEVDVPNGFIDPQFPRPDVDVTVERNPAKLYQTVTFEPGKQVMNGERALQYIRSRHASGVEGSDDARSIRQQLVIQSLMKQLIAKPPTENITLYGQLFAYYQEHFAKYLSMTELLATAKVLYPVRDKVVFVGHSLSVYPQDPQGVLFHPPESTTNGAWVYKIRDVTEFRTEVQQKLNNE